MTDKKTIDIKFENGWIRISQGPSTRIILVMIFLLIMILTLLLIMVFFEQDSQKLILSMVTGIVQLALAQTKRKVKKGGRHVKP